MTFNILLAIIPVAAGWLFYIEKGKFLKCLYGLVWFFFLPNTIYLFTDLIHFFDDWVRVSGFTKIFVTLQYLLLILTGFITFVLAFYPFEKIIRQSPWRRKRLRILSLLNFLIGFGIVLGRIERINSWDIITAPQKVLQAVVNIFNSAEATFLVILFGLFANFFYLLFKEPIISYCAKVVKKISI